MNIKDNIFYYSNPDHQDYSRITRDFINKFFIEISNELKSDSTASFIRKTIVPTERELYGVFVKSLTNLTLKNDDCNDSRSIGHIGTEFRIERGLDPYYNPLGRVDLVITYRNIVFAIELKVVTTKILDYIDSDNPANCKALSPWLSAAQQAKKINKTALEETLENKVISLPITLHFYIENYKDGCGDDWKKTIKENFSHICFAHEDNKKIPAVEFFYLSCWDNPIATKAREAYAPYETFLYGFSLISTTTTIN